MNTNSPYVCFGSSLAFSAKTVWASVQAPSVESLLPMAGAVISTAVGIYLANRMRVQRDNLDRLREEREAKREQDRLDREAKREQRFLDALEELKLAKLRNGEDLDDDELPQRRKHL